MYSPIDFQYNTVNEFIKQVLGGYILMSIEENYSELNSLYINIKEWITMSFELNFKLCNYSKLYPPYNIYMRHGHNSNNLLIYYTIT